MIKVLLSVAMAVMCLVLAAQNLMNLRQALGAVAYVIGNVGHEVYPHTVGPTLTAPWAAWVALLLIISLEFLAGVFLLRGSYALARSLSSGPEAFDAAKRHVYLGAGIGILVWFGLFQVLGGAVFQQWQTEAGWLSLQGAAIYAFSLVTVCLFLAQTPD